MLRIGVYRAEKNMVSNFSGCEIDAVIFLGILLGL